MLSFFASLLLIVALSILCPHSQWFMYMEFTEIKKYFCSLISRIHYFSSTKRA